MEQSSSPETDATLDREGAQRLIEDAERSASDLAGLAESLVGYADSVKREVDELSKVLREAAAVLGGADDAAALDAETPGLSSGAQMLVTQMAVGGASRDEIEHKLRDEFGIEESGKMLDLLLGKRGSSG